MTTGTYRLPSPNKRCPTMFLTVIVVTGICVFIFLSSASRMFPGVRSFLSSNVDPTSTKEHAVAARFEARRRLLEDACQRHWERYKAADQLSRFRFVIEARGSMSAGISYCPIPKTGSCTWTYMLETIVLTEKKLEGGNDTSHQHQQYHQPEDVVSFTTIREPYSRLLSAYVDKIFTPSRTYSNMTGRYILTNFRPSVSPRRVDCGFGATFLEFIQYFISMQQDSTSPHRDIHFVPEHELCHMCEWKFTYISHLETSAEDMPFILRAVNSTAFYNQNYDSHTIVGNSRGVFEKARHNLQLCDRFDEGARRLWKKWQIRGIIHKSQAFPLTREETKNIEKSAMAAAGLAALARSGPKEGRVGQKKEALREAFASVPLALRLKVKELLFLDFEMFGFDPEPDEVFPATPYMRDPHFSYFDLYT